MDANTNPELEAKYQQAAMLIRQGTSAEHISAALAIYKELGDYGRSKAYVEKCEFMLKCGQGMHIEYGQYKGTPISWQVMKEDGNRRLLFMDSILPEYIQFHHLRNETNWADSDLRAYLNGEFLEQCFTAAERMPIITMNMANSVDPRWGAENGPDTRDKVFLFNPTELAYYKILENCTYCPEWWWLRGHGDSSSYSQFAVDYENHVYNYGIDPTKEKIGVRAAMWIRMSLY